MSKMEGNPVSAILPIFKSAFEDINKLHLFQMVTWSVIPVTAALFTIMVIEDDVCEYSHNICPDPSRDDFNGYDYTLWSWMLTFVYFFIVAMIWCSMAENSGNMNKHGKGDMTHRLGTMYLSMQIAVTNTALMALLAQCLLTLNLLSEEATRSCPGQNDYDGTQYATMIQGMVKDSDQQSYGLFSTGTSESNNDAGTNDTGNTLYLSNAIGLDFDTERLINWLGFFMVIMYQYVVMSRSYRFIWLPSAMNGAPSPEITTSVQQINVCPSISQCLPITRPHDEADPSATGSAGAAIFQARLIVVENGPSMNVLVLATILRMGAVFLQCAAAYMAADKWLEDLMAASRVQRHSMWGECDTALCQDEVVPIRLAQVTILVFYWYFAYIFCWALWSLADVVILKAMNHKANASFQGFGGVSYLMNRALQTVPANIVFFIVSGLPMLGVFMAFFFSINARIMNSSSTACHSGQGTNMPVNGEGSACPPGGSSVCGYVNSNLGLEFTGDASFGTHIADGTADANPTLVDAVFDHNVLWLIIYILSAWCSWIFVAFALPDIKGTSVVTDMADTAQNAAVDIKARWNTQGNIGSAIENGKGVLGSLMLHKPKNMSR